MCAFSNGTRQCPGDLKMGKDGNAFVFFVFQVTMSMEEAEHG